MGRCYYFRIIIRSTPAKRWINYDFSFISFLCYAFYLTVGLVYYSLRFCRPWRIINSTMICGVFLNRRWEPGRRMAADISTLTKSIELDPILIGRSANTIPQGPHSCNQRLASIQRDRLIWMSGVSQLGTCRWFIATEEAIIESMPAEDEV